MVEIIEKLFTTHTLSRQEYKALLENFSPTNAALLAKKAEYTRTKIYGTDVYIRGLIEVSNICKSDCLYCGIRRENKHCDRYRLTQEEILECCQSGYALGFRTFVLQGGEDPFFTDDFLCGLLEKIKSTYPDCAVTLSLGERRKESYQRLFEAGANRYLLRHETASKEHYEKLHPKTMSFENRMECLKNLREIGYQVGCGFMVGSPYQTLTNIVEDLLFIQEFQPDMCGIGPFLPHKDTPFANESAGDPLFCCYLLSIVRLIKPNILLPATTALGSIDSMGREKGILAGANVVMPNLSPSSVRSKYLLYNGKLSDGAEAAEGKRTLEKKMESINYHIVTARGDIKNI